MGKDPLKKPHKSTPKPMLLHEILLIKDVGSLAPHQLPRNILIPWKQMD